MRAASRAMTKMYDIDVKNIPLDSNMDLYHFHHVTLGDKQFMVFHIHCSP